MMFLTAAAKRSGGLKMNESMRVIMTAVCGIAIGFFVGASFPRDSLPNLPKFAFPSTLMANSINLQFNEDSSPGLPKQAVLNSGHAPQQNSKAAGSPASSRAGNNTQMMAGGHSSCNSGKGRSHLSPNKTVHGFSLVKGKASHPMEDYHVAEFTQIKGHELGLYAIFDGHLGDSVASYLQKNLFSNILNEEEFWVHPSRAITKAYDKTDKAILIHTPDLGRGGSTAVTAILIDGLKLLVANVGDSRAVLSKNGRAIQLSVDHEPSTERGSIENRGGFVSNIPGDVPRVNGQLAVSRAFGDRSLKTHLRSDPDVREWDVDSETQFLILASDGLWKVMDNQEAVNFVSKIKDPHIAAKQLTAEALKRESKDDISCIVVQFR